MVALEAESQLYVNRVWRLHGSDVQEVWEVRKASISAVICRVEVGELNYARVYSPCHLIDTLRKNRILDTFIMATKSDVTLFWTKPR